MTKKFNLKSGNCPSFKEMGGDSPFTQGVKNFIKKAAMTSYQTANPLAFAALGGGNQETFFNSKKMRKREQEQIEEEKRLEEEKKEKRENALSSSLERSMQSVHRGHSRSTEKMRETNEDLPEQV